MSQENINQDNDLNNEFSSSESYLATFEAAIQQLQRIIENPQSGQKTTLGQNQQQLLILQEKYEKIEQLVYIEQEQIEQLITTHVELQKELNSEYSQHQALIVKGKKDILQLTLANKQALQIQNDGQRTLESNQQEAERIVQYIQKLQKDIQSLNIIMQDKQKEENNIENENIKLQNSIDEFRKDQNDQKEGLEDRKLRMLSSEKQVKQVRKEQFDMQKKLELMKKTAQEIKQKTIQFQSDYEVALSELRNEKRTLGISQKKFDEINKGLESIQNEIQLSDQHLEQIRELNKNMKNKVQQIQNAVMIYQAEGPDSEELKTLEGLLGEYNQLLDEKQKVYQSKEQEKNLLQEHLQQMSNFAQQYVEKQQQQQQNENQLSNFTHKLETDTEVVNQGGMANNNSQTFGMECIQSQYEQEQESSANTQSLNIISQHQSKKVESEKQTGVQFNIESVQINQQPQGNQLQQQQDQEQKEEQNQQQCVEEVVVEVQQQILQNPEQNLKQQQIISEQQTTIQESEVDQVQTHLEQDSSLNNSDQKQQVIVNNVYNQSFGNTISPSLQESPVQMQHQENNYYQLDSEQQQIQSEFVSGSVSVEQSKLKEFIESQEKLEKQNDKKSNDTQSNQNSSNHTISESSQKMMIKFGLPGFGGYNNILNQLKSGFQQNNQQQ